jgi:hypothetical protein
VADTIYCNYCAHILYGLSGDVTYLDIHDNPTGDVTEPKAANAYTVYAMQSAHYPEGEYYTYRIMRSAFCFDTSSIPIDVTIESVQLKFYVYQQFAVSGRPCSIVVQNGQPTYPHNPTEAGDYLHSNYSGNGGEVSVGTGWKTITFTEDAIDWINRGGETKLILRINRDINSDATPTPPSGAPTRDEGVRIYHKANYYAQLIITYPTIPVVTTQAASVPTPVANPAYCEWATGNGTIVSGENITDRGFEIVVEFSGDLYEEIQHSMAGFEGDTSFDFDTFMWVGTLTKTETENIGFGDYFEVGAYDMELGSFPAIIDKLFAGETYTYRAFAINDIGTGYGDWVEFSLGVYTGDDAIPTDDISEGNPTVPIIPIEPEIEPEIEYPPFEWQFPDEIPYPPWDWDLPDLPPWVLPNLPEYEIPDYPVESFVGDFYYHKPYTKKDLDELRKKCIIYNKNSVEFALVLRHNINVLREFFNMMTEYMDKDEFNDFTDLIPPQRLKELYLDDLEVNDFKDMINEFIRNNINNNIAVNRNFDLIQEGLSDYENGSDDAYFNNISSTIKTMTENNPDVDTLKRVVDNLNQEVAINYNTIMHNLEILRARLL